jgi:hypothetical protein
MSLIKISGSEVKVDANAAAQAAGLDGGKRNPGSQFIDFVANQLNTRKTGIYVSKRDAPVAFETRVEGKQTTDARR